MYNNENNTNDDYKNEEDDYVVDNQDNYYSNVTDDNSYQNISDDRIQTKTYQSLSLKKILIIVFAPVFFVTIAFIAFIIASQLNLFENYNTQVEYTYNSKIKSKISTLESSIEKALEKNNLTSEELIEKYNQLEAYYDEIETYARIEYANTCYYVENANARRYKKYRAILDDMDEWFSTIKNEIYYSGYSTDFFANYSDYEIDLVVNHPDTSESIAKEDEANEVASEYAEIVNPTLEEGYEYLARYITLNNEFAELKGYDNYIEYAYYELYNRDYSYTDTKSYASYINSYLLGSSGALYKVISSESKKHAPFGYFSYPTLISNVDSINYSKWNTYTSAYANYIGGDYLTNYTNFTTNGYLVESDADYYDGGYSTFLTSFDMPLMYLGGDAYQNVFTYIHEYGHCNAFYTMKNNPVSLDLCETQSQGNEMMFLAYLIETEQFDESPLAYLKNYQVSDMLQSLIISSMVNSFETALYTYESELTANTVSQLMRSTINSTYYNNTSYGLSYSGIVEYAETVMLASPGYYISYSTSAVAAFELLIEALDNYSSAITSYNYLADYANYTTFRDTIIDSGLSDPMSEETFKLVFETNLDMLL